MTSRMSIPSVVDIRDELVRKYEQEIFVKDKTGCNVIEIIGAHFIANEDHIFGKVNEDYIRREFQWYRSQSLNVNDFPDGPPTFWLKSASNKGEVNSNYGYLVFSEGNYHQYTRAKLQLLNDRDSRRAIIIYTRPKMQIDYNRDGMSDFVCTNTTQYLIRDERLHAIVNMRSNDVVLGYRNDFAWQAFVRDQMLEDLKKFMPLEKGEIIWQAGSLHVYERHFHLIEEYIKTGNTRGELTKK